MTAPKTLADSDAHSTAESCPHDEPSIHVSDNAVSDVDAQTATRTGRERRIPVSRVITFAVLPAVALLLTLAAAYLKYQVVHARIVQTAQAESVRVAADCTIAMLSYVPETAEMTLAAVSDRLTGGFRDQYNSLIRDVVIPGAMQQQIRATATVPAASSVSASGDHAVVMIFVDQTINAGTGAPTDTTSVVKVTLDKHENDWRISGFEPI